MQQPLFYTSVARSQHAQASPSAGTTSVGSCGLPPGLDYNRVVNRHCSSIKAIAALFGALLAATFFAQVLISAARTYSPKSSDEIEVLSRVLKAEVRANGWTEKDLICFSVQGLDPSPELVKALRLQKLNVCSSAAWRKKFNCGFEVRLEIVKLDSSQRARVRAEVADFRGINEATAHFGVRQRYGEYSIRKIDGQWSISEYAPLK